MEEMKTFSCTCTIAKAMEETEKKKIRKKLAMSAMFSSAAPEDPISVIPSVQNTLRCAASVRPPHATKLTGLDVRATFFSAPAEWCTQADPSVAVFMVEASHPR
jgi:hypothetical protein